MDLFSLKGKKAIVTGGTRGLGYGMAEGLCRAGAEVAILGTSEKVRESADALARTTGVVVHGIVGDLVREEEVPNIYKRLVESLDGQAGKLCGSSAPVRGRRFSDGRVESDSASKFRCYVPDVSAGGAGYAAAWIRQDY